MYQTNQVQHRINSGYIDIVSSAHTTVRAFWAYPITGGNFPGLVLLHEWWGLTSHVRLWVRHFAESGYFVIAPDLYQGRTATTSQEGYAIWQALGANKMVTIDAAFKALETHNRFNGKMGVVGWQTGGELAYEAALTRTDLQAAVIFYARPDSFLPTLKSDRVPLLAFYGSADSSADLRTLIVLRDALMNSPAHGEVVIYHGATTGFFNDEMPSYHPKAAADAWVKTLDFLSKHLTMVSTAHA